MKYKVSIQDIVHLAKNLVAKSSRKVLFSFLFYNVSSKKLRMSWMPTEISLRGSIHRRSTVCFARESRTARPLC